MNKTVRKTPATGGARTMKSNAGRSGAVWPTTGGSRTTAPSRKIGGSKPGITTPGFKPGAGRKVTR